MKQFSRTVDFFFIYAFLAVCTFALSAEDMIPPVDEGGGMRQRDSSADNEYRLACEWLKYVEENDPEKAILAAGLMVPPEEIRERLGVNDLYQLTIRSARAKSNIDDSYPMVVESAGISSRFLESENFTHIDFKYWKEACFFKKIADELKDRAGGDKIRGIYEKVSAQVKNGPNGDTDFPIAVWDRGTGSCDRQSWVFWEIARQSGVESMLVFLIDKSTGISPHTVVTAFADNGSEWIVDIFEKKVVEVSIADIKRNPEDSEKVYPDNEKYRKCLRDFELFYPGFPLEYCIKNNILQEKLSRQLKDKCPVFGRDPMQVVKNYEKKLKEKHNSYPEICVHLWIYPFLILSKEINRKKK